MIDPSAAVLENRTHLEPIPIAIEPRLKSLPGIRAVVFDIYGTLVISGSGDVGSADRSAEADTVATAIAEAGIDLDLRESPSRDQLNAIVRETNEAARRTGVPSPEVDIVDVWRELLRRAGAQLSDARAADLVRLAARHEAIANPTWPMPGAAELIGTLRNRAIPMGIVSNAQVFTIPIVADLVDSAMAKTAADANGWTQILGAAGFRTELCVFSNRFRHAKPGPRLFDVLVAALRRRDIDPVDTLYVGNDRLNDIYAASVAGLRTAWFAGDRRSARRRIEDSRCAGLDADVVLTTLDQLPGCLV